MQTSPGRKKAAGCKMLLDGGNLLAGKKRLLVDLLVKIPSQNEDGEGLKKAPPATFARTSGTASGKEIGNGRHGRAPPRPESLHKGVTLTLNGDRTPPPKKGEIWFCVWDGPVPKNRGDHGRRGKQMVCPNPGPGWVGFRLSLSCAVGDVQQNFKMFVTFVCFWAAQKKRLRVSGCEEKARACGFFPVSLTFWDHKTSTNFPSNYKAEQPC